MDEKLKKKILSEMESIIGNRCYNGNIQNWGAGGEWLGEGREFRYPIIFLEKDLKKDKCWRSDPSMSIQRMRTGHYAFGANRLYIIQALEKILENLENKYQFKPINTEDLINCEICNAPVNAKNLKKHIRKVHEAKVKEA
ncbi:hypothetical protein [Diaphorobacter sp. MNS-0]|uniref:hypothetical protein n=1 Tax=Diaphorobacter sp. MNS-0 TaxID=2866628 RepID=UPI001C72BAEF|nr:hypothetical protein [Diaphorobacter sp. MNS-0]QYY25464.1 hypothetical protein K2L43_17710 [Diaphorobacter sp. MNS-0]